MKIKMYRAPTTKAALEQIKRELGADAFILGQKEVRPRKLLGVFRKSYVEVTAAIDYSVPRPPDNAVVDAVDAVCDRVELCSSPPAAMPEAQPAVMPFPSLGLSSEHEILLDELRKLKSMVRSIPSTQTQHTVWLKPRRFANPMGKQVYTELVGQGIEEKLASDLVADLGSSSLLDPEFRANVASALSRRIHIYPDLVSAGTGRKPEVVVLLGPTGVGKTTTLAKIAARAALQDRLKVGMVTLDTFRIAAIEQLKTYAEIIGIPIRAVETVKELTLAIEGFADRDLVLIDTTGQSPNELSSQWELAEFMFGSAGIKKALVVSATTKQSDLRNIINRYDIFGIDCLIYTKLDETDTHGPVINELVRSGMPLAYVTTGQRVPQDIARPDAARIAALALGPKTAVSRQENVHAAMNAKS